MLILTIGLALFVLVHLVPAQPGLRAGLIGRLGENGYKGLFSLVAAGGLALIVLGFAHAEHIGVWEPPGWGRHVTLTLMMFVFPLLVMAYLPGRLSAKIKHPMLAAVKIWAFAHLFIRGDAASMLLFAVFLGWAVYDRISLKKREAAGQVSIRQGPVRNDVIAIVAGLAIYAVFLKWGHDLVVGVPLI